MKLLKTKLEGAFIIDLEKTEDERGFFSNVWNKKISQENNLNADITELNIAFNKKKGTIRGLHYQLAPAAQTKLVRVIQGRVLDVAVDIRKGSPTFGQSVSVELTAENKKQLLVPRGFAHGFVVLEDDTIFAYKVDNYYSPENDRGIAFDDKALSIEWQVPYSELNLSAKDKVQPKLAETNDIFEYGVNYYND